MTLSRRPVDPGLVPIRDVFDRFFRDPFFSSMNQWSSEAMPPSIDIREDGDNYVVEAELPGVRPEDVEVTLDGRTLTIRGSYSRDRDQEQGNYLLRERRTGSFARSVMLPIEIDADHVETDYKDGELRITLPKAPQNRARRIEVKSRRAGEGAKLAGSSGSSMT